VNSVSFPGQFGESFLQIMNVLIFELRLQKSVLQSVDYFSCYIKFNLVVEPGGEVKSVSFPGRFGRFYIYIWKSVGYFRCHIKFNLFGAPGGEVNSVSFPGGFWGSFLRIINVLIFELRLQKFVLQSVGYFSC